MMVSETLLRLIRRILEPVMLLFMMILSISRGDGVDGDGKFNSGHSMISSSGAQSTSGDVPVTDAQTKRDLNRQCSPLSQPDRRILTLFLILYLRYLLYSTCITMFSFIQWGEVCSYISYQVVFILFCICTVWDSYYCECCFCYQNQICLLIFVFVNVWLFSCIFEYRLRSMPMT